MLYHSTTISVVAVPRVSVENQAFFASVLLHAFKKVCPEQQPVSQIRNRLNPFEDYLSHLRAEFSLTGMFYYARVVAFLAQHAGYDIHLGAFAASIDAFETYYHCFTPFFWRVYLKAARNNLFFVINKSTPAYIAGVELF